EILNYHQCPAENLILRKNSELVPENRYVQMNVRPRRLDANAVMNLLGAGTTLVIDNLDDLDPVVRNLAQALEQTVRVRVWINLYAAWGNEGAFKLHFDDHDTMILQLSGKKHWQVYAPTREYPFRDDIEAAQSPDAAPIWEGIL